MIRYVLGAVVAVKALAGAWWLVWGRRPPPEELTGPVSGWGTPDD